jgi:hypothetical protein
LSLKTKVGGLSVVWPQNHWDGLSMVWTQNHWYGFSRFGLKTGGGGFFGLCLKTDSYGLMVWSSKSPRWLLDLGLKTKQASIYRLRHKSDERRAA